MEFFDSNQYLIVPSDEKTETKQEASLKLKSSIKLERNEGPSILGKRPRVTEFFSQPTSTRLRIKQEAPIESEPHIKFEPSESSSGLNIRTQFLDQVDVGNEELDADEIPAVQSEPDDEPEDNGIVPQQARAVNGSPKNQSGSRYVRACRHYKNIMKVLPDPKNAIDTQAVDAYMQMTELVTTLKGELDHENEQCRKIRQSRREGNKKFSEAKQQLEYSRQQIRMAEKNSKTLAKQVKELNTQLKQKVAQPHNYAQVGPGLVYNKHTAELAKLRTEYMNEKTEKEKLEDVLVEETTKKQALEQQLIDSNNVLAHLKEEKEETDLQLSQAGVAAKCKDEDVVAMRNELDGITKEKEQKHLQLRELYAANEVKQAKTEELEQVVKDKKQEIQSLKDIFQAAVAALC